MSHGFPLEFKISSWHECWICMSVSLNFSEFFLSYKRYQDSDIYNCLLGSEEIKTSNCSATVPAFSFISAAFYYFTDISEELDWLEMASCCSIHCLLLWYSCNLDRWFGPSDQYTAFILWITPPLPCKFVHWIQLRGSLSLWVICLLPNFREALATWTRWREEHPHPIMVV